MPKDDVFQTLYVVPNNVHLDGANSFQFNKLYSVQESSFLLNVGSIRICILTTGVVSNETNEDVRMYT